MAGERNKEKGETIVFEAGNGRSGSLKVEFTKYFEDSEIKKINELVERSKTNMNGGIEHSLKDALWDGDDFIKSRAVKVLVNYYVNSGKWGEIRELLNHAAENIGVYTRNELDKIVERDKNPR